jgi:hypothetical protein
MQTRTGQSTLEWVIGAAVIWGRLQHNGTIAQTTADKFGLRPSGRIRAPETLALGRLGLGV